MKVLITGGLGNLGSWLTDYFVKQGHETSVLTKNKRTIHWDIDPEIIYCDITSLKDCQEKLSNRHFDAILHTASVNDVFVPGYPEMALKVNGLGTRNILEAIKETPPSKFIYFSTFHVYGKGEGELNETTPTAPKNDYGTTHLFGELYTKQFHQTHHIPFEIIRLSNSYGCPKDYDSSKWYLILNDLSKMAFEEQKIELKGNGKFSRDFIWMGDVANILEQLATIPATNEIYNLSGGKSYQLLEVAQAVQKAYKEYKGIELPIVINKEDKSEPKNNLYINSEKLQQLINYDAQPHFKEQALEIFKFLSKKST